MTLQSLPEITDAIEQELLAYSPIIRRLLVNRGILTRSDAYMFLIPSYDDHVHDPFLLKDVDKAIDRIQRAIESGEKIAVYADYDCDGIPGAVIMNDFFGMLGYQNIVVYIPDRHKEGYGLQKQALTKIIDDGAKLIVTVDLGITNNEEVLFCNEQGVDVIVTDHHLPGKEIPKAHAVVNPKQEDCIYPDPMLCGSGVAFKLVQAFLKRYGEIYKILPGQEKWLLDMVGLATLSDMVPLVNENRVFAHYGLMVFRKTRRPGLVHLLKKAGLRSDMLTEDDLTFTVSPRINAAGRMDHPRHAYQLLATKDKQEAEEKSLLLHDYNLSRKNLVKTVIKQAKAKLEARKDHTLIVVGDRTWPVGIVGLVASRLVEEYGRPAFVWGGGEDDTILKGSCRSDGSINMVELMSSCKNSFVSFGGHELAGGFAVSLDAIHFLESELSDSYENLKTEISRTPVYSYDMDLSFDEVTPELYDQVSKLAPFGVGNPKPIFLFRDSAIEKLRLFGKHNEHLELTFRSESGRYVKAIAFFKNHESFGEMLREGSQVQLFASLEKSYFGYKTEFRLRIEAIHVS